METIVVEITDDGVKLTRTNAITGTVEEYTVMGGDSVAVTNDDGVVTVTVIDNEATEPIEVVTMAVVDGSVGITVDGVDVEFSAPTPIPPTPIPPVLPGQSNEDDPEQQNPDTKPGSPV